MAGTLRGRSYRFETNRTGVSGMYIVLDKAASYNLFEVHDITRAKHFELDVKFE